MAASIGLAPGAARLFSPNRPATNPAGGEDEPRSQARITRSPPFSLWLCAFISKAPGAGAGIGPSRGGAEDAHRGQDDHDRVIGVAKHGRFPALRRESRAATASLDASARIILRSQWKHVVTESFQNS